MPLGRVSGESMSQRQVELTRSLYFSIPFNDTVPLCSTCTECIKSMHHCDCRESSLPKEHLMRQLRGYVRIRTPSMRHGQHHERPCLQTFRFVPEDWLTVSRAHGFRTTSFPEGSLLDLITYPFPCATNYIGVPYSSHPESPHMRGQYWLVLCHLGTTKQRSPRR